MVHGHKKKIPTPEDEFITTNEIKLMQCRIFKKRHYSSYSMLL